MSYTININAFNAVQPAASTEQIRYNLNGVHIEDEGDQRIYVATNGHIMMIVKMAIEGERLPEPITIKTPKQVPAKFCKNVEMTIVDAETVVIKTDKGKTALDIIDGAFPEWRKVVPSSSTPHANFYIAFKPEYMEKMDDFIENAHMQIPRCEDDRSAARWQYTDNEQTRIGILMPCTTKEGE